ncbi:hypothetical protein HK104_004646 [Borealophlyctis nickersoniae]|nr:hypothetical protein HK104_004646 [Borealophlyctis nickersoniae]
MNDFSPENDRAESQLFDDCVVEVSSDSDDVDGDILTVNPHDLAYVRGKLTKNAFEPVMFARRCKWTEEFEPKAHSYVHDCVKAAINDLNKDDKTKKPLLKAASKNVKRLRSYDWSPTGPWGHAAKVPEAVPFTEFPAKRQNKLKRLLEADEELTSNQKRVRAGSSATSRENKGDDWRSVLKTGIWDLVPDNEVPSECPWKSTLEEVSQHFKRPTEGPTEGPLLVDLRTGSPQLATLPPEVAERYGGTLDDRFGPVFPDEARALLETVFGKLQAREVKDWEHIVNSIERSESDCAAEVLAVVKLTFPAFCRAFERDDNPLKSQNTLEAEHLATFIHPIFRECCHRFAHGTVWRSGEIATDYSVHREKGDGIAVVTNRDAVPIGYFEGSRPVPKKGKGKADGDKILRNVTTIFASTVSKLLGSRRRVPDALMTFGAQSVGLELICSVLEYRGDLFCHEFERANVPAQESDILLFVELYQCIISWAMLMGTTIKNLENTRAQKRASRKSHIMASHKLAKTSPATQLPTPPNERTDLADDQRDITDIDKP